MKKVIMITQVAHRPQINDQKPGSLPQERSAGRRGVVLEFPHVSPWPLFAAGIALLAVVSALAPAVHV